MIPASYLYKDAFRQHWGKGAERIEGEMPVVLRMPEPGPSTLQTARDLFGLALGPRRSADGRRG